MPSLSHGEVTLPTGTRMAKRVVMSTIQRTKRIAMKTLLYSAVVILLAVASSIPSQARISKDEKCSLCHTMHNSQGGVSVAFEYRGSSTTIGPQNSLVKYNCQGCHTSTGTGTICSDGTPIVYNTGSYENPLAGGNFKEMMSDKTKGHNVAGITTTTDIAPPGFKALSLPPTGFTQGGSGWGPSSWSAGTQVTCAGEYGCHGDRSQGYDNWEAVKGAHHGDYTAIDGSTVAKSYRFLAGIKGAELNGPSSPTITGGKNKQILHTIMAIRAILVMVVRTP